MQLIADSLQPSDAASFALCNHILWSFLGPTYWEPFRRDNTTASPSERTHFLTTIARGIPHLFFCHRCSHLHPLSRTGPPGPSFPPIPLLCCFEERPARTLSGYLKCHEWPSYYHFKFHHVHLAMERHRLGPQYGLSTDLLSFIEVHECDEENNTQRLTTLLSVDAQIYTNPDRLRVRLQNCIIWYHHDLKLLQKQTRHIYVCCHTTEVLPLFVSRGATAGPEGPKSPRVEARNCPCCELDYQLEINDFDGNGNVIIITKWLDLGLAATPVQQCCDRLAEDPDFPLTGTRDILNAGANSSYEQGKVRSLFEIEQGRLTQQSFTQQSGSYLMGQRYKKDMPKYQNGLWILQTGNPIPSCMSADDILAEWLKASLSTSYWNLPNHLEASDDKKCYCWSLLLPCILEDGHSYCWCVNAFKSVWLLLLFFLLVFWTRQIVQQINPIT